VGNGRDFIFGCCWVSFCQVHFLRLFYPRLLHDTILSIHKVRFSTREICGVGCGMNTRTQCTYMDIVVPKDKTITCIMMTVITIESPFGKGLHVDDTDVNLPRAEEAPLPTLQSHVKLHQALLIRSTQSSQSASLAHIYPERRNYML